MMRVAVSILNFEDAKSTIACLHSILGTGQLASPACIVEVFVCDNASGADESKQLQQAFVDIGNVHLHINAENLGFSAGHNQNLRMIFEQSSPDYIWLLNNDCLVREGALTALLKCAQHHPGVGVWGTTLLESDGQTIQCAGGCFYNAWLSSYRQYGQGKDLSLLEQLATADYDYIAGASLFFPVATLTEGLKPVNDLQPHDRVVEDQWLNESFFLYFEELDLARRLRAGLKMGWCKDALVVHTGRKKQRNGITEYHATLSALIFTRLYYPNRLWFTIPARYLAKCLQLTAIGKLSLIAPLTRAYRDFFRLSP